jgi:DNA primase small subunit
MMPHSATSENASAEENTMAAEVENHDSLSTIHTLVPESTANGDSQLSNDADKNMTMADIDIQGVDVLDIKLEMKPELKLEDLFADVESDDEFGSSAAMPNVKGESSPEAPASPMFVLPSPYVVSF